MFTLANIHDGLVSTWQEIRHLHADVAGIAGNIAAAFLGATVAFNLARHQQKQDLKEKYFTGLITTQYVLFSQLDIILGFRINHLDPVRSDPSRFSKLRYFTFVPQQFPIPFAEITSILQTPTPHLLQDIHIAQEKYYAVVQTIGLLNNQILSFRSKYQPVSFDPSTGKGVIVEPRPEDVYELQQAADLLYEKVDDALPFIRQQISALFDFIKKAFPKRKALKAPILPDPIIPQT